MRPALSDYQHLASGKVRELYRIDDEHLLFVATDRISAYDYILDTEIPDKGRILTAMSVFFFDYLEAPNHLAGPPDDERIPEEVLGRALVVQRARDAAGGVRGPRLPDRLGPHRLPEDRQGVRHRAAAGPDRGQQVRPAAVHPGHQGRTRTTRREHHVRRCDRSGRRRAAPTSCANARCRPTSRAPTTL